MFGGEDKRKYMRFETFLEGTFSAEREKLGLLMLTNLSKEGLKASLNRILEPGDSIKIELWIPGSIIPVFVHGQVVWIRNGEKEWTYRFDAGIRICDIDDEDRNRITDYAYEHWRRSGFGE